MRPQQNRRIRGRGNNNNGNNRRPPNPLTRNYESNGPDVKIRGNAQHIADKYAALARDVQAAGDRVMAENYLQHAEHYMRIILSAQPQFVPSRQSDPLYEEGETGNIVDLSLMDANGMEYNGAQILTDGQESALHLIVNREDEEIAEEGAKSQEIEEAAPPVAQKVERVRRVARRRLPRAVTVGAEQGVSAAVIAAESSVEQVELELSSEHFPKNGNRSETKTALEQFPKSVKRFSDKNCGENNKLEQISDSIESHSALEDEVPAPRRRRRSVNIVSEDVAVK